MLRFLTAGESHGPALVAILEGIPAGLPLEEEDINPDLIRRQFGRATDEPYQGASARMKKETDRVQILSGVMAGKTTGAPIALLVPNLDHAAWLAKEIPAMTIPRPGHADLTAAQKYHYDDLRLGLERASARETTARTAVAAVCRKLLAQAEIMVGSYVTQIGEVKADVCQIPYTDRLERAEQSTLRCPDPEGERAMTARIQRAVDEKDTLGGVVEIIALGVPAGLGSHVQWDRRLGARLAAALMSIPAIKGIEIGDGFGLAATPGIEAQDAITVDGDVLQRATNHNGGIEGGITNGEPIVLRVAMKPISTVLTPRASVDLATGKPAQTRYERSDFCAVPRAAIVAEAMTCFILTEALLEKIGGDNLDEFKQRLPGLPKNHLGDIAIDASPKKFW